MYSKHLKKHRDGLAAAAKKHGDSVDGRSAATQLRIFDRISRSDAFEDLTWVEDKITGERRFDSEAANYVTRQLEHVMQKVFEMEFPTKRMAMGEIIPIDRSIPEGAEFFTYYLFNSTGVARFTGGYSSGTMPMVSSTGAKVTARTEQLEIGYRFSTRDIRNAQMAGDRLEARLAKAARQAHVELKDLTGTYGDEARGLAGMVTHPNITVIDAPVGATTSNTLWADKINDEIINDFGLLLDGQSEATFGQEDPTHCQVPRGVANLLRRRVLGTGDGGRSLWTWIRETWQNVEFEVWDQLTAANSDGKLDSDSVVCYVKDIDKSALVDPMEFKQHPVQASGLEFVVPTESVTGGVRVTHPLSISRMRGVA